WEPLVQTLARRRDAPAVIVPDLPRARTEPEATRDSGDGRFRRVDRRAAGPDRRPAGGRVRALNGRASTHVPGPAPGLAEPHNRRAAGLDAAEPRGACGGCDAGAPPYTLLLLQVFFGPSPLPAHGARDAAGRPVPESA